MTGVSGVSVVRYQCGQGQRVVSGASECDQHGQWGECDQCDQPGMVSVVSVVSMISVVWSE